MSECETAWLAGLLEGEGCFHLRMNHNRPGRSPQIVISLKMTDEDVVERALRLMGGKTTIGIIRDANPRWSDRYLAAVYAQRAEAAMRSVLPYMGLRRRAKIVGCLTTADLGHRGPGTVVPSEYSFDSPLDAITGPLSAYWLAGLLEGEGCFHLDANRHNLGRRPTIRVSLRMADEDVVRRASELMGGTAYLRPDSRPNASDCFDVRVNGCRAEGLMRMVLPHMGDRRSEKIRECLGTPNLSHHPKVQKAGEATL